ncbi:MAG: AarF/UbiB family protein [Rhodospirillales bacterium]|jgi:predicted unusual protein kinase regulating ubiquinone biosynthesis (AarF/ABC1/UbiB family)|nr:AarF/UbiB family protein [Rhodospirillales bacterium]
MAGKEKAEENSLGGRVRRYARVGTTVGGLAARFAGRRALSLDQNRGEHAVQLKAALGNLKGPLMKVAQIAATVPDALPDEYITELAQLQTNAPPMGWAFVKRRMNSELGSDWQSRFSRFEHDAAAAASLGQVHRAIGLDGRRLACKLQYPDMGAAVEADLVQLKMAFSVYRRYDGSIDPTEVHAELSQRLREELDYRREAANMALYRRILKDERRVYLPEAVTELSTDRLLTMTWLKGQPLMEFVDQDEADRNAVAVNMFRAWYAPFYGYGVIHGDPHLGNYSVRPNRSVNLMDFGCIRVFKPSFVTGVIELYRALRDSDEELAVHAYEIWGFTGLDRQVIDVLNLWARFVYAPLMEDRVQSIQETDGSHYGAKIAAKVHRELRRLGGVTPPREFVLMDRAAIGLGSVFLHLKAKINWCRLFHDLIEGYDEDKLARRQARALKRAAVPLA